MTLRHLARKKERQADALRHDGAIAGLNRPRSWSLSFRMPVFHHGSVEIAYLDEGQGEPIVLVHGFASSRR